MVRNFRYVEEGTVALAGVPETPEAVDWLHEQGIRGIVSLHPVSPEVQRRMEERGIAWLPFPVTTFAEGVGETVPEMLGFARRHLETAPALLFH